MSRSSGSFNPQRLAWSSPCSIASRSAVMRDYPYSRYIGGKSKISKRKRKISLKRRLLSKRRVLSKRLKKINKQTKIKRRYKNKRISRRMKGG